MTTPISTVQIATTDDDTTMNNEGYSPLFSSDLLNEGCFLLVTQSQSKHEFKTVMSPDSIFDDSYASDDENEDAHTKGFSNVDETMPLDYKIIAEKALSELQSDYDVTLRTKSSLQNTDTLSIPEDSFPTCHDDECLAKETIIHDDEDSKGITSTFTSNVGVQVPADIDVDIHAIQRAVQSIQIKNSNFTKRYSLWQKNVVLSDHVIIPSVPLSAFRKSSKKAEEATFSLTRSATIAHALVRLKILDEMKERLCIDVIGVDSTETKSSEQIRRTFGPFIRWLSALPFSPIKIDIRLIGPNIVFQSPVDLLPKIRGRLQYAVATCYVGTYHEAKMQGKADMNISFNAGLWGYDDWIPTFETLKGSYFVVTSYTVEEAEDDAAVIMNHPGVSCIWQVERNPFASRQIRETKSIRDRVYHDNAAWQAWKM
jgi:hypothetical protein